MKEQTLDDLTSEEFEQLLDDFIQRDDEEIPISTFFAALELIDREKRQQIIDDGTRKIIIHLNTS